MSREALWQRVEMAWTMLSGRGRNEVRGPPPRDEVPPPRGDEPESSKEGFSEEALPWLDAVYRFALRLTGGERDAAEDLTQDTFLRAHRHWHQYERGTNAKSWLFTICRNTYLHEKDRVRNRREQLAADLDARVESLSAASAFEKRSSNPERELRLPGGDRVMMEAMGMLRCEDALARLWDFLDGELPPDQRDALRRHLEVCNRCFPQYDFQRAYLEYTRRLAAREHAPPGLRKRIFRAILREERSSGNGGGP